MSLNVPDEVLRHAGMSESELLLEIAVLLFQKEKLTLAQAGRLAGASRMEFQKMLASRGIPIHYGVEDFKDDLKTLHDVGIL
jgi:predicted HTH domain antitoxin